VQSCRKRVNLRVRYEEITGFRFYGLPVRVFGTIEEPMFLAAEIAEALDYVDRRTDRMLNHCSDCNIFRVQPTQIGGVTNHGPRKLMVNEFGMYEILFRSRQPKAERFANCVFGLLRDLRLEQTETLQDYIEQLEGDLSDWHYYQRSIEPDEWER